VQRVGLGAAAGATLAVPLLRAAFLTCSSSTTAGKRKKKSLALALLVAGAAAAVLPLFRDASWAVLYALGLEGEEAASSVMSWKLLLFGDGGDGGSRRARRQRIVSCWALALLVALPVLHFVAAPASSPSGEGEEEREEREEREAAMKTPRKKKTTATTATRAAAARRKNKRWPPRPPTILLRKAYHVLALAMFAPVVLSSSRNGSSGGGDPGLLCVGLAVAAAALFAAEAARASGLPLWGVGSAVSSFMGRFVDARDQGALLVSHFSLLLGMAGPLWLLSLNRERGGGGGGGGGGGRKENSNDSGNAAVSVALSLAGVVSLGTVDAAASAVGRALGKKRLLGTRKTLEGTAAGAAAGALAWAVLWPRLGGGGGASEASFGVRRWLLSPTPTTTTATPPLPLPPLSAAVLASTLSALMEASTTQLDNVFLPLHHLAALGALARLLGGG